MKIKKTALFAMALSIALIASAAWAGEYDTLSEAAYDGTAEDIIELVKNGADPNARDEGNEWTPLMYAAIYNPSAEVINALVESGAKLEERDEDGMTALMHAARDNYFVEVVDALLKAGAKVDARDEDKMTVLMYAAQNNKSARVIETLINAGADVNASDEGGWTPLVYAARFNGSIDVIKALLDAGAEVNDLALNFAEQNEVKEIAELLAKASTPKSDLPYEDIFDALDEKATAQEIEQMIRAGADVDMRNSEKDDVTPLMCAAGYNLPLDVIETLLNAGANANLCDRENRTALTYAAAQASSAVVEALIKAGIEVNDKDNDGKTPLMYAAWLNPSVDVIKALLNAGADMNVKDEFDNTVLGLAEENNNPEILAFLKEAAATPKASIHGTWRMTDGEDFATLVINDDETVTFYDGNNEEVGSGYLKSVDESGHYKIYVFDEYIMDLYFDPNAAEQLTAVMEEDDDSAVFVRVGGSANNTGQSGKKSTAQLSKEELRDVISENFSALDGWRRNTGDGEEYEALFIEIDATWERRLVKDFFNIEPIDSGVVIGFEDGRLILKGESGKEYSAAVKTIEERKNYRLRHLELHSDGGEPVTFECVYDETWY